MNAEFYLLESGYEVIKTTKYDRTSLAVNRENGDKFYFDVRRKQAPSFRKKTGSWEFGIDVPEYNKYFVSAETGLPFIVFFETGESTGIRYINRDEIGAVGRVWSDEFHFPNGIIFIKVEDTSIWEIGIPFTNYRKIQKIKQEIAERAGKDVKNNNR